jgi:hypothetical protein
LRRSGVTATLATVTMGGNDLLVANGDATRNAIQTVADNCRRLLTDLGNTAEGGHLVIMTALRSGRTPLLERCSRSRAKRAREPADQHIQRLGGHAPAGQQVVGVQ